MLDRRHGIRESAVRRHYLRADAVREREIYAVVYRMVEGQRQASRIGGGDLVGAPAHRQVLHVPQQDAGGTALYSRAKPCRRR